MGIRLLKGAAAAAVSVVVTIWTAAGSVAAQSGAERLLDPSAPIPYFVADGTGRTGFRASDRELATWALDTWQRHAGGELRFVKAEEADALVRVYWAGPREGQYGEMRPLLAGGRRGAAVYIRPDVASLGPDIARRTR